MRITDETNRGARLWQSSENDVVARPASIRDGEHQPIDRELFPFDEYTFRTAPGKQAGRSSNRTDAGIVHDKEVCVWFGNVTEAQDETHRVIKADARGGKFIEREEENCVRADRKFPKHFDRTRSRQDSASVMFLVCHDGCGPIVRSLYFTTTRQRATVVLLHR